MIKSWLIFILPKDEYKKQRVLHFLAEASVVSIIYTVFLLFINIYINIDVILILIFNVYILIVYFLIRYIFSGIEFGNIINQKEYRSKKGGIFLESFMFFITFSLIYIIFTSNTISDWIVVLIISFLASLLFLFINLISLNRSYHKNINLK